MRYLLNAFCILLITTTFAWGANIDITKCYEKEQKLSPLINEICEKYGAEVNLVKAIIRVESVYNPKAVSKCGGQKGLMQLSGSTARKFGTKNAFDPRENIEGGVRYLKHLENIFGFDLEKIVASYNVGEGKVHKKKIPPAGKKYVNLILSCKVKYDSREN
jgi:soluble lytic murein transglycosylase-like protein